MHIQMMKNLNKLIFTFITCFVFIIGVNAEEPCTYKEKANLNEIASRVKTSYEVVEETVKHKHIVPDTLEEIEVDTIKRIFKISVYNVTEDLYVKQYNDLTNEEIYIFYGNTEQGVYTFETEDIENIIKYTYNIHSNSENCKTISLKTYNFIKPKVNMYSQYALCEGKEDIPYCQTYITEEVNVPESDLYERIENYTKSEEKKENQLEENTLLKFIKENYIYFISGVIILGAVSVTIIVIYKKRSALWKK